MWSDIENSAVVDGMESWKGGGVARLVWVSVVGVTMTVANVEEGRTR